MLTRRKDRTDFQDIRVYAMPNVSPTHTVWSLVAQGKLTSDGRDFLLLITKTYR